MEEFFMDFDHLDVVEKLSNDTQIIKSMKNCPI